MAEHGGGIEIEVGKGTEVVLWLSVEQEDEGRGTEDCGLWTMDKGLKYLSRVRRGYVNG